MGECVVDEPATRCLKVDVDGSQWITVCEVSLMKRDRSGVQLRGVCSEEEFVMKKQFVDKMHYSETQYFCLWLQLRIAVSRVLQE